MLRRAAHTHHDQGLGAAISDDLLNWERIPQAHERPLIPANQEVASIAIAVAGEKYVGISQPLKWADRRYWHSNDLLTWKKGPPVKFKASVKAETISNPFLVDGKWNVLYEQGDRVYRAVLTASEADEVEARQLKAGAAARVVNPTRPAATIGHRVMRTFTETYTDLRVQVLVLEDKSGKRLAWMGCDFAIVPGSVVDRIKRQIHEEYAIEPAAVCINSSHTHSAPPLAEEHVAAPEHWDAEYAEFVVREAVVAVGDAVGSMVPARVRYVEDSCKVGINRRGGVSGKITMAPKPDGVVDHRVQLVAVEAASDGQLVAVMVKYACHPVTVVNIALGADYPGYMRQFVEKSHPGAVVVFMQGCGADVRIRVVNEEMTGWVRGTLEKAEQFGRELADAVERALKKQGLKINGPIETEYAEISLPLEAVSAEAYQEAADRNDAFSGAWGKTYTDVLRRGEDIPTTWPYRIQAFRLGDGRAPFTLVALDGEVFTEYGLNLGKMLQPTTTIVLGYSNGVVTYLPTAEAMAAGGYEPTAFRFFRVPGPYTPEVESMVLKAAVQLARPKSSFAPRKCRQSGRCFRGAKGDHPRQEIER